MSVRANLLLLFGLLVAVLVCAAAGFYWAVEQSLSEQDLLLASRRQLVLLHTFSKAAYRQAKEVADVLVLGEREVEQLRQARQTAAGSLNAILKLNAAELATADQADDDSALSEEREERENCVKLQAAFAELCAVSDATPVGEAASSKPGWSSVLQRNEQVFDRELVAVLDSLMSDELDQLARREARAFQRTRRMERIAVAVCLATVAIVILGGTLLVRALQVVVRREGAEAANHAKSQFLANMSHEIRTPMTAILGFAEILAQDLTDPEKVDAAATIRRNGEHLLELINGILDLSKIEAGKLTVDCARCSPWQITADVCSLMRTRAAAKGIKLVVEHHGPIPQTILSGPLQLRQILINLIGNAIKFTEIGSVRLVTQLVCGDKHPPRLRFDVIDTGAGMSPAEVDRLFVAFTQLNSPSTKHAQGTGLGLAISKRLAELLGGTITVSSAPGRGSTFSVTIPTGPLDGVEMLEHLGEVAPRSSAPGEKSGQPAQRLAGRILLAEDGPDNQRLLGFVLRRAGAEVTVAENGQVALDQVLQPAFPSTDGPHRVAQPFDLILMDMQMPVMDGYEATRRLREMGYRGPIVALTAHAMSADREQCLQAGCDDYATKPVAIDQLLATVARYLPADGNSAEPTTTGPSVTA
jgi:signal transduction histidine kinase/ActR/RegA family two-component response regulator